MSTDRWVERWIAAKVGRGCVPLTIVRYRWTARRAIALLGAAGRRTNPHQWSPEDVRWLRTRLHDEPWQIRLLADLARFASNPVFAEVGLPRHRPPQRVRWLSEPTVQAIVRVTEADRRLRLVALLGIAQGLRRIEWIRLRTEDIDLATHRLLVRGKGRGQPKLVWMSMHPALPMALSDYLEVRARAVARHIAEHPDAEIPGELFVHAQDGSLRPYTVAGADRWVDAIGQRLRREGIEVKLASHMFRRSGATFLERALLRSPDASRDGIYRAVQGFLRHDNLATTMRYLETDPSRQVRTMEQFAAEFRWWKSADPPRAPTLRSGAPGATVEEPRDGTGRPSVSVRSPEPPRRRRPEPGNPP